MSLQSLNQDARSKMEKSVSVLQKDFAAIRTKNVSTSLVEGIIVDCYGQPMPINQLATLSIPEPNVIAIQPWDSSNIESVSKAIMVSDLGLMPNNDGHLIRVMIPALSEERRNELIKVVRTMAEDSRIVIRNIRREINESIKKMAKQKEITEDDERKALHTVQETTDVYIDKIKHCLTTKEEDLLEI